MKRALIFLIIISFSPIMAVYGQIAGKLENPVPENVSLEQVYVHLNSTFLLSGEFLYYKFYCLDSMSGKLSRFSKAGWVELVNSAGETVFLHKLNLSNGTGYSDFFVPATLSSGSYKLLGYTSWMTNARNNYFVQDITILNPYQESMDGITISEEVSVTPDIECAGSKNSNFDIELDKKKYLTRESVVLEVKNPTLQEGHFSLSVRQLDDFDNSGRISALNFSEQYEDVEWNFSDAPVLPELRGNLIKGKVIRANGSSTNLSGKSLVISFPEEESLLKISRINENGEFFFNLNDLPQEKDAIFQVLGEKEEQYTMDLEIVRKRDYSNLQFSVPVVNAALRDQVLERSINNQVENAYSAVKSHKVIPRFEEPNFFGNTAISYQLDDFNRFPDVEKTFTEVIQFARVRKNPANENIILVRSKNPVVEFQDPALLVVDGVVVQNHQNFISYNAEKIKTIKVVRDKYYLGPEVFQGVVVVETVAGDFPEELRDDYHLNKEITGSQPGRKYFQPDFKEGEWERIPDFRNQLLWMPELEIAESGRALSFFTSDVIGKYEIVLEGFTSTGESVSLRKMFEVE